MPPSAVGLASLPAAEAAAVAARELERHEGRVLSPSGSSKSRPPHPASGAVLAPSGDGSGPLVMARGAGKGAAEARELASSDLEQLAPTAPADARMWLPAGFTDDDDDDDDYDDYDDEGSIEPWH